MPGTGRLPLPQQSHVVLYCKRPSELVVCLLLIFLVAAWWAYCRSHVCEQPGE